MNRAGHCQFTTAARVIYSLFAYAHIASHLFVDSADAFLHSTVRKYLENETIFVFFTRYIGLEMKQSKCDLSADSQL